MRNLNLIRTLSLSVSILAMGSSVAFAQGGGEKVSRPVGNNQDNVETRAPKNGDPLPDIDVSIGKKPGGSTVASTKTDRDGKFRFSNVPPGIYTLVLKPNPGAGNKSFFESRSNTARVTIDIGGSKGPTVVELDIKAGNWAARKDTSSARTPAADDGATSRVLVQANEITITVAQSQTISGRVTVIK